MTKNILEHEVRGIELNSVEFHLFKGELLQIIWDMVTKRKKKRQKRLLDTFCRVRERGHCSQASEAEQPFEDCSGNQKNILGISGYKKVDPF